MACQYSKLEIVEYLTEEEPLVDVKVCCHTNKQDGEAVRQNGLHMAAIHNDVDVAKQLIKAGCPLDVQDLNVSS